MSFTSLPQRWVNAAAVFLRLRLEILYAEQAIQYNSSSSFCHRFTVWRTETAAMKGSSCYQFAQPTHGKPIP